MLEKWAPANFQWSSAIASTITSFGYQQMITGIIVVVAGLSQLNRGISIYYWQAISHIAWLSAATHLITLRTMRKGHKLNRTINILRLVTLGILVVFVAFASWPTGIVTTAFFNAAQPAWCFYFGVVTNEFTEHGRTYSYRFNWIYYFLSFSNLILGFITEITLFFSSIDELAKSKTWDQPWKGVESQLESLELASVTRAQKYSRIRGFWLACLSKALKSIYMLLLAGCELYSSCVWEVSIRCSYRILVFTDFSKLTWSSFALVWGTTRMIVSRTNHEFVQNTVPEGVTIEQNTWGFGQVVALGLLVCPVLTFCGKHMH